MDFVGRDIWSWSLYWTYWMCVARKFGIRFHSTERPLNKIPDDNFPSITPLAMFLMFFVQSGYGAIHLSGWDLTFPTDTERLLWHISTVTITVCIFATWCVDFVIFQMPSTTLGLPIGKGEVIELNVRSHRSQTLRKGWLHDFLQDLRNVTRPKDPEYDIPLRALIPVTVFAAIYCVPRGYVIIEGFINIRALPPDAYQSVDWTKFIPHV